MYHKSQEINDHILFISATVLNITRYINSAHGYDFHKYADDTELSQSAPPDEFCSVQTGMQTCFEDVLSWMNSNKLTLNTDKADIMAVGTSSRLSRVHCNSANIGSK